MTAPTESELPGARGRIVVTTWPNDEARYVALLAHGYGEHVGRYDHVARALVDHGAVVYGPDHLGHGKSEGEPVLIEDVEDLVSDLQAVAERARAAHPSLPIVLIGHSMGGIVATRYVQRNGNGLAALVLSGPVIGGNPAFKALLEMDPIPPVPIPPDALSRDPEVGREYEEDPLVWHGPFKRPTLEALFAAIDAIAAGPSLGALPTLWIHGEQDALAPLEQTREAVARVRGDRFDERIYPGAQHEVLNEINKEEVLRDVTSFVDGVLGG